MMRGSVLAEWRRLRRDRVTDDRRDGYRPGLAERVGLTIEEVSSPVLQRVEAALRNLADRAEARRVSGWRLSTRRS